MPMDIPLHQPKPHLPGELGVWVFILGDMVIFGLLFGTFLFYRADDPALYQRSQATLNQNFGAINTIVLLSSSWLVAKAVQCARQGARRQVSRLLAAAWLCGLVFAVVKVLEYSEKISHGITLVTNDFYMYYFVLTGLHFVHLLLGMGVLGYLWIRSRHTPAAGDLSVLESGASFWHLADLLWIVLFPLIYLIQ